MEGLGAWAMGMAGIVSVQPGADQTWPPIAHKTAELAADLALPNERPTLRGCQPPQPRAWYDRANEGRAGDERTLSGANCTGREPTANGRAAQETARALKMCQMPPSPVTCTDL